MSSIKPTIEYIEQFTVSGFSTRTKNSQEMDPKTAKIPSLWQQLYSSELINNTSIFGVYADYESDTNGLYTLTLGVSQEQEQKNLSRVTIASGNYLVFKNHGPMPTVVIDTWKQIWHFFTVETQYQRNFKSDFELYDAPDQVAVYIGIQQPK
ncbi:MAG: effector binding domain-containing protein [Proteobacteria bacterium]|nr:effector binding domain-containing protein [Pseudomonadota bacterium]